MRFLRAALTLLTEVAPVFFLCVTTVIVAADVVGRTLFNRPVFAASEIALIAFVWLVWFGSVGLARQGELMAVNYFVVRSRRYRPAIELLADVISLAILGYVLFAIYRQVTTARFTVFETTELPKWILAAGVEVALALMALVYVHRIWLRLAGKSPRQEQTEHST